MANLINNSFMLRSSTAERLYFDYAKNCPIIDYHCHLDAKDIADDVSFENITQLWLSGDHYKWRLMRSAGIEEDFITGNADDYEKFIAWASVVERAIGNPMYHWSSLELYRYFDIKEPLGLNNADQIWETVNAKIQSGMYSARQMIDRSNVELLCTTDDPIDDLSAHRQIAADLSMQTLVLPTFRPDRVMDIEKNGYYDYLSALAHPGSTPTSWIDLKVLLSQRLDHFAEQGCRLSDHAMERFVFVPTTDSEAEQVFHKKMSDPDTPLTEHEIVVYKSALLLFFATECHARGWTMQLHFGCRRDNNASKLLSLGPNSGYDTISGDSNFVAPLADFMSLLDSHDSLPRMILYSLNPNDDPIIDTLIGCFQNGGNSMRIQHGAAWWFNDNERGIRNHLRSLASQSYLPGFIGMLTDSRSLLSYTRHEYFRRILCDYLGELVERGEFVKDMELVGSIVQDICYNNARKIFMSEEE